MEDNYREQLIRRIAECEEVVGELETSKAWQVLTADLELQRGQLDANWQNLIDPEKLQRARELKHAVSHVLLLKNSYKTELEERKRELHLHDNPEEEITRDYDSETNIER